MKDIAESIVRCKFGMEKHREDKSAGDEFCSERHEGLIIMEKVQFQRWDCTFFKCLLSLIK